MSEHVAGNNGGGALEKNKKIQQEKLSIVHSPPQHNKNASDLSADVAAGDGEIPVIVYEIDHVPVLDLFFRTSITSIVLIFAAVLRRKFF